MDVETLRKLAENVRFFYSTTSMYHVVSHFGISVYSWLSQIKPEQVTLMLDILMLICIATCLNEIRYSRDLSSMIKVEIIILVGVIVAYSFSTIFIVRSYNELVSLKESENNENIEASTISIIANATTEESFDSKYEFKSNEETSTVSVSTKNQSDIIDEYSLEPIEDGTLRMAARVLEIRRRFLDHMNIPETSEESFHENSTIVPDLSVKKRYQSTFNYILLPILPALASVVMQLIKVLLLLYYKSIMTKIRNLQQANEVEMVEFGNQDNQD